VAGLLEARLALVAQWCRPFEEVADVGAGAGRLSRYLARLGHKVWASELRPRGVQHLAESVEGYDIQVVAGDGLHAFANLPPLAVVAGMGGVTIAKILQSAPPNLTVIVQPMQGWRRLREVLATGPWRLLNVGLVEEKGRFYPTWMVQRAAVRSGWHPVLPVEFRGEPAYGAWLCELWRQREQVRRPRLEDLRFFDALEEEMRAWGERNCTNA
jgi:tRNA (adenine22-N1)-methyltransferase